MQILFDHIDISKTENLLQSTKANPPRLNRLLDNIERRIKYPRYIPVTYVEFMNIIYNIIVEMLQNIDYRYLINALSYCTSTLYADPFC